MDKPDINIHLEKGHINQMGIFPHLDQLDLAPFVFNIDFGLNTLPEEAGIISIRGARQYGKSTWLESALKNTIQTFGPATGFYLNGDYLLNPDLLEKEICELLPCFKKDAPVRRIFIDEITAIPQWEIALKRLADSGLLRDILIVTTGSNATDLRRGIERLPGRKGKLARTNYLFTPLAYREFHRVCHDILGEQCLIAYLLSGGSPVACAELAKNGYIPEYLIELTRDWIDGEIARANRTRNALRQVIHVIYQHACTPLGQAKLAREANLANNTVAQGYITILNDLGVLTQAYPWDAHKKLNILRKPCKFHFTNLLAAMAYSPLQLRSIEQFNSLSPQQQSPWLEWCVAQELLRRSALAGEEILAPQSFWQNKHHEIDFVTDQERMIEVKRGQSSAREFAWFAQQFPGQHLTLINQHRFETDRINGMTLEDFLLEKP